jgi:hypothetical protein
MESAPLSQPEPGHTGGRHRSVVTKNGDPVKGAVTMDHSPRLAAIVDGFDSPRSARAQTARQVALPDRLESWIARRSVAPTTPNHYSPGHSERSAARLAHQSGGLGVPSSNLGAPTRNYPIIQSHMLGSAAYRKRENTGTNSKFG